MANMVLNKTMRKLNLGCGDDYKSGWINLDFRNNVNADVKHDLNKFPYPFKDNSFDEVLLKMILEHLDNSIKVLREVIRISHDNAKVTIIVPRAFSYANNTDIQHKTRFTENSFNENLLKEYELEKLKLISKEFLFPINKWKRFVPLKCWLKIYFNGIYDDIKFEFEVKK